MKGKSRGGGGGGGGVIMVPLILFTEDTSGNQIQKWSTFVHLSHGIFFLLALVVMRLLSQVTCISSQFPIRFSPLDQCVPIVEELLLLESEGIDIYDAFSDCQVSVECPFLIINGRNIIADIN